MFPASGQPGGSFRVALGYACRARLAADYALDGNRSRPGGAPAGVGQDRRRAGAQRAPAHPCRIRDDAVPAVDRVLCQTRDSSDPAQDAHAHQGRNPAHFRSVRPDAAPSAALDKQAPAATEAVKSRAPAATHLPFSGLPVRVLDQRGPRVYSLYDDARRPCGGVPVDARNPSQVQSTFLVSAVVAHSPLPSSGSARPAGLCLASRGIDAFLEYPVPLFPPTGRHSAAPRPLPSYSF